MKAKAFFSNNKFLEKLSDMGIEVTEVFVNKDNVEFQYKDHRKCGKRRLVMRHYPSAFDRLGKKL